ncbi:AMP-binding protein [Streptomyces globisporus]|uniref:AMP-binding protein n=1 Tax=Streptomyces TaxID=1883 RepID=UPI0029B94DBC|nr:MULTISPECIES: AMP-binding protein [unclassified Streptomyces]MDX3606767.1 AMP-binding protein [Streptomyces sp. FL06-04B]MDX3739546.1 AMP-binding protein [Streptomyces sp. ID01-15D]
MRRRPKMGVVANDVTVTDPDRGLLPASGSAALHRYAAYHVSGGLDLDALRTAWRAVAGDGALVDGPAAGEEWGDEELCARWAARPFAEGDAPARLHIARSGPRAHLLLLVASHSGAWEGPSGALPADLSDAYRTVTTGGRPPARPPLRAPRAPGREDPPATASGPVLPADRNRPHLPPHAGSTVAFDWSPDLGFRTARLAEAERVTPAAVVLAGFQALVHRYAGQDDGTLTTAFRELLRTTPDPASGPCRIEGADAVFVHEGRPGLRIPGAEVRRLSVHNGTAAADLTLVLQDTAPCVTGFLEYRDALFEPASARRLLEQLAALLSAATADPDTSVGGLPLEDDRHRDRALRASDRRVPDRHVTRPVHVSVRHHAEHDGVAVSFGDVRTGYAELTSDAARVASALLASGAGHGSPVAVRMQPGAHRIAVLLGVLEAGAHLAWFAPGGGGERHRSMLRDLRPACMVLDGGPQEDPLALWYAGEPGARLLDVSRVLGPPSATAGATATAGARPSPADLAYVAFTSGSTGRPKGILQSHAALTQFAGWMGERFAMGPGARVAQWVSPEHDPALAEVFATLLAGGTLCPVPERVRVNPDKLVPWLVQEGITHLQTVPSFARDLLGVITGSDPARRPDNLSHLLLMGEALPGELVDGLRAALPRTRLINLYGPTETIAATWHEITGPVTGPVPIGHPLPGRQVLVVDEHDRPSPAGVTGELVVRSPYVTPGYLAVEGGPDHSALFAPLAGFAPDGDRWYRTGDLARTRFDGALEFRGRRDFQVKLFGNRVELTEIEAALNRDPSVLECAVLPHVNAQGLVTRLAVYVVPRKGGQGDVRADVRAWRSHLRGQFGPLALPAVFTRLTSRLPRNAAGKVDRSRLTH